MSGRTPQNAASANNQGDAQGAGTIFNATTLQEVKQLAQTANTRATYAQQMVQSIGIPITLPLIDNTRLGSGWVRVGVWISAGTAQTAIPHKLGRQPSGIIQVDNSTGGVVYRTAADTAATTAANYYCRATTGVSITCIII